MQTNLDAARGPTAMSGLRGHWREYLIEGWALGVFMISAAVFTTLLESPASPVKRALHGGDLRRVLIGIAMGLTAMALIYSPWGQRSGAHMNPAVTLTYLRLGHVSRLDAGCYILAQLVGGTLGVYLACAALGGAFAAPPVQFVTTVPGPSGTAVALGAELIISFLMMTMILCLSNSERFMRYTGLCAGALVTVWIIVEAPLSGMSMNPARTLASAVVADVWDAVWIYVAAPIAGMLAAAELHVRRRGTASVKCAKLLHTSDQRCIHCGFVPRGVAEEVLA